MDGESNAGQLPQLDIALDVLLAKCLDWQWVVVEAQHCSVGTMRQNQRVIRLSNCGPILRL
jgi:hypothetical protein